MSERFSKGDRVRVPDGRVGYVWWNDCGNVDVWEKPFAGGECLGVYSEERLTKV